MDKVEWFNNYLFGIYRGIRIYIPLGDYFIEMLDVEALDYREIDLCFKEQYC